MLKYSKVHFILISTHCGFVATMYLKNVMSLKQPTEFTDLLIEHVELKSSNASVYITAQHCFK